MRLRGEWYQISLIGLGAIALLMFAVFMYRELFPEYLIYQDTYVELEKFRSNYSGKPPPPFKEEVKQIVIEREDFGPPTIDRCISCHVALQFTHFSPTKIAKDVNGNIIRDVNGNPTQVPNEEYVWSKLDQKIAELRDIQVNEQLKVEGDTTKVQERMKEADRLESMKTAHVGEQIYDMTKVLRMHPLMGKETRPFEFHPMDEYGCVICHNGNGRGLTTEKAHGPIFDGQYEIESGPRKPTFLESDPQNDPPFARMFNEKPDAELLFQTNPLFIGPLIQAKCVQCHQPSSSALQGSLQAASTLTHQSQRRFQAIQEAIVDDKEALTSTLILYKKIQENGLQSTFNSLQELSRNYELPPIEQKRYAAQLEFLNQAGRPSDNQAKILDKLFNQIGVLTGSEQSAKELINKTQSTNFSDNLAVVEEFVQTNQYHTSQNGTLLNKVAKLAKEQTELTNVLTTKSSLDAILDDSTIKSGLSSDIDLLTKNFQQGQTLYISQACYACHRIAGFARGGVGPELTREGKAYPWFIKESIVWPQADLKTSTMPNFHLDHNELQDLMTFIFAQTAEPKTMSTSQYKANIQEWDAGKNKPAFEKPISAAQIHDLRFGMTVFATEGCAACHRLKGFESNVGFAIEKNEKEFNSLYNEKQWFTRLFPETITGSQLVATVDKNFNEIDKRIVDDIRSGSILEEIETEHPGQIESFYSEFEFASRAKDHAFNQAIKSSGNQEEATQLKKDHTEWKKRIRRILMMYIQEYGLGRLICPRPNWSGIHRTDEWLIEHFRNPSLHVPKSIMPVFPFDDTKFYALTYMLDQLSIRNRDEIRAIWENRGFDPEFAFQTLCAQCHGDSRMGNGPVAPWIYPIPKNLQNADFLRNLTRERVVESIAHGVKGTPMPPWGEVAVDKPYLNGTPVLTEREIEALTDWLFVGLPGGQVIKSTTDVPKWEYGPEDVIEELQEERSPLLNTNPNDMSKLYASMNPEISNNNELFDVRPNPVPSNNEKAFYIKQKFYTNENLEQGQAFFEMNCSVCHGKDAEGTGVRAEFMQDAKPRMLTNLDWINTRDDLRLLRSIKFGVPGTSMTPWGDLTSSFQRLQLVMYIRSLTEKRSHQEILDTALYQTFETAVQQVARARAEIASQIQKTQISHKDFRRQRVEAHLRLQRGEAAEEEAIRAYKEEINALGEIDELKKKDHKYEQIKQEIKRQQELFREIGNQVLSVKADSDILNVFTEILDGRKNLFDLQNSMLIIHEREESSRQANDLFVEMLQKIDARLAVEEKSIAGSQQLLENNAEKGIDHASQVKALTKLRQVLLTNINEANRSNQRIRQLVNEINAWQTGNQNAK